MGRPRPMPPLTRLGRCSRSAIRGAFAAKTSRGYLLIVNIIATLHHNQRSGIDTSLNRSEGYHDAADGVTGSALLLPVVANAQPVQGLYVSLDTGANFAGDMLSSPQKNTKIYTDAGPVGLVDLGWGFGNGLRAEIEGSIRSNDVSGFSTRRASGELRPLGSASGSAKTYALDHDRLRLTHISVFDHGLALCFSA